MLHPHPLLNRVFVGYGAHFLVTSPNTPIFNIFNCVTSHSCCFKSPPANEQFDTENRPFLSGNSSSNPPLIARSVWILVDHHQEVGRDRYISIYTSIYLFQWNSLFESHMNPTSSRTKNPAHLSEALGVSGDPMATPGRNGNGWPQTSGWTMTLTSGCHPMSGRIWEDPQLTWISPRAPAPRVLDGFGYSSPMKKSFGIQWYTCDYVSCGYQLIIINYNYL